MIFTPCNPQTPGLSDATGATDVFSAQRAATGPDFCVTNPAGATGAGLGGRVGLYILFHLSLAIRTHAVTHRFFCSVKQ